MIYGQVKCRLCGHHIGRTWQAYVYWGNGIVLSMMVKVHSLYHEGSLGEKFILDLVGNFFILGANM